MVGNDKVVVYRLRNAHYAHFIIMRAGVLRQLCRRIHRIVSAYVEEIADVVLFEDGKQFFVKGGVVLRTGELAAA